MQGDGTTSTNDLSAEDLELFAYLLEEEGVDTDSQRVIPRRDPLAEIPLSLAQERMWFLDQWDPGNPASNIPFAVRLKGRLSIPQLQRSLNEIVRRHEGLRTTFRVVNDHPQQIVAPSLSISLPLIDLSTLPHDSRESEVQRLIAENAQHRFNVSHGPLLRADLLQLSDREYVFLLNIHHAVFDAWSVGLFLRELTVLYEAFVNDQPSPLPELAIQYPDFAIWQRDWLQGDVLQQQLAYWKRQLGGSLPVLDLPGDYPRPRELTYHGALGYGQFPAALTQQLHAVSQSEGATLFMTLFAAFQTLLYRYTGEEDIITGSVIANRDFVDIESLMGFFLNTLPLRTDLSGNPTFREFLQRTREMMLDAYAHQNVPFEHLVEELRPPRDTSHTPLFQVMFILQNAPVPAQGQRDLEMQFLRVDNGTSKYDLTLSLTEAPDGLRAVAEYKTDLFEPATIERLLGHYRTLLESIVTDIDQPIANLPLLTIAERERLQDWNAVTAPFPEDRSLAELFAKQAARTPEALALSDDRQELTFAALDRRANRLAWHLRSLGVAAETRVGLCLPRSVDAIVALLAILKAGGAYVPLDPSYPAERLRFMADDATIAVLLTDSSLPLQVASAPTVCLDSLDLDRYSEAAPPNMLMPDNLIYVIYTSGSTGRPKGVLGTQRGMISRLQWMWTTYPFTEHDRCCQKTALSFIDSVGEIFGPLLRGAPVHVIADEIVKDPVALVQTLAEQRITRIVLVASLLRAIMDTHADLAGQLPDLWWWAASGEAVPLDLAQHFAERMPHASLVNLYGSSEVSADATYHDLRRSPSHDSVPIGRPVTNMTAHVLDRALQPVPIGVPGEIYVGGVGLARGYHQRPDLTAERFLPDPFSALPGARLYRIGDRGRWRADGTLDYLGRVDFQVKLRGYRIEPGEIEAVLLEQATVSEASVIARADAVGDQQLVAYVVLADTDAREHGATPGGEDTAGTQQAVAAVLRAQMATRLPPYMVPQAVVMLEILPRTPNGKIDRKALSALDPGAATAPRTLVLPRTPVETVLAALWSEVLGREPIGVEDDFFELGGHSLKATRLLTRVRETFHVNLGLRSLFQATTVATLAEVVIANEVQPGQSEKVARILLQIHGISAEDRQRLLEQKRKDRGTH